MVATLSTKNPIVIPVPENPVNDVVAGTTNMNIMKEAVRSQVTNADLVQGGQLISYFYFDCIRICNFIDVVGVCFVLHFLYS